MKSKKIIQIVSMIMCLSVASSMTVFAEETELNVYSDTDQIPYVDNIDDYLAQLNVGLITSSKNTVITTYESTVSPFDLSEPSKSCSNIFGYKWGDWSNWEEFDKIHYSSGTCLSKIKRWRFCERTHCGASQTETDSAWVSCSH